MTQNLLGSFLASREYAGLVSCGAVRAGARLGMDEVMRNPATYVALVKHAETVGSLYTSNMSFLELGGLDTYNKI